MSKTRSPVEPVTPLIYRLQKQRRLDKIRFLRSTLDNYDGDFRAVLENTLGKSIDFDCRYSGTKKLHTLFPESPNQRSGLTSNRNISAFMNY